MRYDPQDRSRVHCWYEDQYYGEGEVYLPENDYLKRQALMEKLHAVPEIIIPSVAEVPLYSYLERKLAAHRLEVEEADINNAVSLVKAKKEQVKAALDKACPQTLAPSGTAEHSDGLADNSNEFGVDRFTHLLAVLLKRALDAHDRLAIHTVWRAYGPFSEGLVRKTVGRLLGDGYPTSNLAGYLDALRIAVMSEK